MQNTVCILVFGLLCGLTVIASAKDYEGYKVIRVNLQTDEQVKKFAQFGEKIKLDFWRGPSIRVATDILVSPEQYGETVEFIKQLGLEFKITDENVGKSIKNEKKDNDKQKLKNKFRASGSSIVGTFARHADINKWINKMARKYKICSVIKIGKTYEGREMNILRMATGPNKPIIFIDAGIHAREWLAPATILYIMNQLAKDFRAKDKDARSLLDRFEFQFLPVVNPDGYEFTHLSPENRLFRKTRKPYGDCFGADPNRNFDADFGGLGTNNDSCTDIYHGPHVFSEIEAVNFRDHVLTLDGRVKLYISLHAYSQMWLTSYGYTKAYAADDEEIARVGAIGAAAIYNTHKVVFGVGSAARIMYEAAGGSDDWMKIKVGVKYSYTVELRPGQEEGNGAEGFMVPVSTIIPSGEEIYNAVKATANAIKY